MGLFRPETRASFENPSISLSDASLIQMFSGDTQTSAGPIVSETGAISTMVSVYRAIALLSGMAAGLPLKTYRYAGKSEVLVRPLLDPGYGRTPYELWETVMVHLLGWGNAFVHKERNAFGAIENLVPINPGRVRPKVYRPGELMPDSAVKVFEVKQPDGSYIPLTNYDLMHIPGLSYDGVLGLSPVGVARQAIGTQMAADDLASRQYSNGNMIGGILTTDRALTQQQADAIKSRWREKMQGVRHAHDVAVLDAGMSFQATTMAPEEAQFLQTRRWQTIEIARVFGIPPHLLGDVERTTSWGTGIEQQNIAFVAYTLRPWLTRIEQRISFEIVAPKTQFAEFEINGLLRGSAPERAAFYANGIQWGWLTRNEARIKENLVPIVGLDEPLTPLNMIAGTQDAEGELAPASADAELEATPNASSVEE
jgi:HK97 family phage portal protein